MSRFSYVAEIYTDHWVDISSDCRVTDQDGFAITTGQTSETSRPTPCTCAFRLNNRSGVYSPRNPTSTYFGLIGRNTPFRLSYGPPVTDTFTRTVSSGFGTTTSGQAWTVGGSSGWAASDFNVGSGVGTISIPAAGVDRFAWIPAVQTTQEVSAKFSLPFSNVTASGAPSQCILLSVILRGNSTSDLYLARASIDVAEAMFVQVLHTTRGVLGELHLSPGIVDIQNFTLVGAIEGRTLLAKAYTTGTAEPDWQVIGTDDTSQTSVGWAGVHVAVASSNTNTKPFAVSTDNFGIRYPAFAGEISAWPPRWDQSGNDSWVDIEASGILRRLSQGNPPSRSALRRYIPTTNPIMYWPLTDGPLSPHGKPLVGDQTMDYGSYFAPQSVWGQGDVGPWLEPVISTRGLDGLDAFVDMPSFNDRWCIDHIRAGGLGADSSLIVYAGAGGSGIYGSTQQWTVDFLAATTTVRMTDPAAGVYSAVVQSLFDRGVHHVRVRASQSGASVIWVISVDGTDVLTNTTAATTLVRPVSISYQDLLDHPGNQLAIGHIALWTTGPTIADAVSAARGEDGEAAGRRIERLGTEEDIYFLGVGDLDATPAMGPQPIADYGEAAQECYDIDQGFPFEPTVTFGLGYRTRESVFNQTAAATLTWAQLRYPPQPTDDDLLTRNMITVRDSDEGSYTATLESGSLSVQAPPDGVGAYSDEVRVNAASDDQLPDLANWRVHLGTVDEPRYPSITVEMAHPTLDASPTVAWAVKGLLPGDRIVITGAPTTEASAISQLYLGRRVTLTRIRQEIESYCAPESAYRVFELDHPTYGRLHFDGQTVNTSTASNSGSLSVATATGKPLVTTAAGDMPMRIAVAGAVLDVSAVSGSSSPQTFTTSLVNGVIKTLAAGTDVELESGHVLS